MGNVLMLYMVLSEENQKSRHCGIARLSGLRRKRGNTVMKESIYFLSPQKKEKVWQRR